MAVVTKSNGSLTVKAYVGDAKTLLAFNLGKRIPQTSRGSPFDARPPASPHTTSLTNSIREASKSQDATEPPNSTINAPYTVPLVHPGSMHQDSSRFSKYTYTVTPRYFDGNASLLPMNPSKSVTVSVDVLPFKKGRLEVAFTRGFMQSQAFVHHFGIKAPLRPKDDTLLYDTSLKAGANAAGQQFSFADEYRWMGYTAREGLRHTERRREVEDASAGHVRVRPERARRAGATPQVGGAGARSADSRQRGAPPQHAESKPEDEFEILFNKAKGNAGLVRATSAGTRMTK
jgi:hypothetical protein